MKASSGEPGSADVRADARESLLWRDYVNSPSQRTRDQLFDFYAPFARRIALKGWSASNRMIEKDDLIQLACTGLLEAIDGFDPARGVPFKGYAVKRVRGVVVDGVRRMTEVREQIAARTRAHAERARSILDGRRELSETNPLEALIDAAIGLAVGFMLEDTGQYVVQGRTDAGRNAYESTLWRETLTRLAAELARLNDRDRLVIERHYKDGVPFDEIAATLGLSKGRISQIHRAALTLLRQRLARAGDFKLER